MTAPLTARTLYHTLRHRLRLKWVSGQGSEERLIGDEATLKAGRSLVGHLNFIHPNRIQVLGTVELEYMEGLGKNSRQDALKQLFSDDVAMVIVADNQTVPEALKKRAETSGTPLLSSNLPGHDLIANLRYYLSHLLAEKAVLHGVFMEVMGIGVLITGEAGIGKSELALELITRGHRLIADDAPEFARVAPDILSGTCPSPLQDFLEVRGLGILNIRAMYGDRAIKRSKYLRLIIRLVPETSEHLQNLDRLQTSRRNRKVLGIAVPEITLPVAPGRDLAVLVEAAVQDHVLRMNGYDAGRDFIVRHKRHLERNKA